MITEMGKGAGLTITVEDTELLERLNYLALFAFPQSRHHLLDIVGALVESQTKDRFETTKTDPDGNPWQPWADSTVEAYERTGNKNFSLLVHGGRGSEHLHTSITHEVHDENDTVEVGTNVTYAAVHNYGANFSIVGNQHEVRIPQRQFLGIGDADQREIDKLVKSYLGDLL